MGILKVLLHVFHLAEGSITTQRALKMQDKHQLMHNFILALYLKGDPSALLVERVGLTWILSVPLSTSMHR